MDSNYPPPPSFSEGAHVKSLEEYRALYEKSVSDPEGFWSDVAGRIDWKRSWDKVLDWDFEKGHIKWFEGATLNVSENCLDRHVKAGRGDRVAFIFEADEPNTSQKDHLLRDVGDGVPLGERAARSRRQAR